MQKILLAITLIVASLGFCGAGIAAEFDINGPELELRLTQVCSKCGVHLVVTTVSPGATIECSHCHELQSRLPNEKLCATVFQICPRCGARLDVSSYNAGTKIKCSACQHPQAVLLEASNDMQHETGHGENNQTANMAHQSPPQATPAAPKPLSPVPARSGKSPLADKDITSEIVAPGVFDDTRAERLRDTLELPEERTPYHEEKQTTGETGKRLFVNGVEISQSEIESTLGIALDNLRLELGKTATTEKGVNFIEQKKEELRNKVSDTLIDRELIIQAAGFEGFIPAESEILDRANKLRAEVGGDANPKQLLDQARVETIMEQAIKKYAVNLSGIRPSDIREYYENNRERFMRPGTVKLRSIIIFKNRTDKTDTRGAEQIAAEVSAMLKNQSSFTELAGKYSETPNPRRIFELEKRKAVPVAILAGPVQTALKDSETGQISGPLKLASSIAFFQVVESTPPSPAPLQEVGKSIESALTRKAKAESFNRWVDELRARAKIEYK